MSTTDACTLVFSFLIKNVNCNLAMVQLTSLYE